MPGSLPLLSCILAMQVALVAAMASRAIPRLMGRDYDAVVMAGGFCGFMLGTTANAMANMGALVATDRLRKRISSSRWSAPLASTS